MIERGVTIPKKLDLTINPDTQERKPRSSESLQVLCKEIPAVAYNYLVSYAIEIYHIYQLKHNSLRDPYNGIYLNKHSREELCSTVYKGSGTLLNYCQCLPHFLEEAVGKPSEMPQEFCNCCCRIFLLEIYMAVDN